MRTYCRCVVMSICSPVAEQPRGSFRDIFELALDGHACTAIVEGVAVELPLHSWRDAASDDHHRLLDHCRGSTLDVGCGPGRLVLALTERGHEAVGIDIVPGAVQQTRRRGGQAFVADVFELNLAQHAWDEGRTWNTVLLADGNIGIGGDPVRLLRRVRELLDPSAGRVVVDVAVPGTGLRSAWAELSCAGHLSSPFRWAEVGAESIGRLAWQAGFAQTTVHQSGDRWWAVLERLT